MIGKSKYFYSSESCSLYLGDSFQLVKKIEEKSIDMIFADPPYFLSSGGVSCHSGKQVCVDKGDWDTTLTIEEKIKYNRKFHFRRSGSGSGEQYFPDSLEFHRKTDCLHSACVQPACPERSSRPVSGLQHWGNQLSNQYSHPQCAESHYHRENHDGGYLQ